MTQPLFVERVSVAIPGRTMYSVTIEDRAWVWKCTERTIKVASISYR